MSTIQQDLDALRRTTRSEVWDFCASRYERYGRYCRASDKLRDKIIRRIRALEKAKRRLDALEGYKEVQECA
jgi:hypothetical protein